MPDLILHHYPASPYSEKVRLVLGFKKLKWKSVTIPAIMPKPDVIALTGGYRRTPLLQIGSDVYCDTTLICRVLESIAPTPTLFPFGDALAVEALSRFGDEVLVNIRAPISSMPIEDFASFFPGASSEWLERYRADRAAMRQGASTGRPPADHQATRAFFLPRMEAQFEDGRRFLLGDAACLADFAVYHAFWVVARVASLASQLAGFGRTLEWMARMRGMGHGESAEISSADALEIARSSDPASLPAGRVLHTTGIATGQTVEVAPSDAGSGQVRGRLLDCSESRISVLRTDARAGAIVVHFPRLGYRLRPA